MDAINWHGCFFLLFAAVACGFAVAVVVAGNIVRMACCLVVSLAAVAGLFFLAGAEFLGAAQLMVYVGGTMVLLIFGVMLTARGPLVSMKTGGGQWVLALVIGVALFAVLLQAATSSSAWDGPRENNLVRHDPVQSEESVTQDAAGQLGLGLLGVREDKIRQENKVLRGGMSGYLLAFEIISVHLVVVLVGAAYLARARRRVQGSGVRTPSPESRTPIPE
ncbi:MAG: NADH-quinone oxidoreductase subunit J [Planctomycetes bacterium]|nr:NADH-quinone oxidoreductase subunit J [Planctomycetota bacterium]MBU4400487.1 NADH-quinone oxidoreductase subunit J [Planctomycetota bacterium]MCG2683787.1 NADH-quinone oxidoreductase subunit J [Planctomycetales bacterium]